MEELVVEWCINSLNNDPQEWSCDKHWLAHISGTKIWIANKWWGLYVDDPTFRISSSGADGYNKPFLEWLRLRKPSWRARLWASYQNWLKVRTNQSIRNWLKTR